MKRVELRPATAADLASFLPDATPYRVQAIAGILEGEVIGIGGLIYRPDGVWAAIALSEEARRYKVAMQRAARMTLAMAIAAGVTCVFAKAEAGRAGASEWLLRLGFRPTVLAVTGEPVFVWRGAAHVE